MNWISFGVISASSFSNNRVSMWDMSSLSLVGCLIVYGL